MLKNANGFLFVVNHAIVFIFAIFAIIKKTITMADVDLGALKFKIGLDDSGLDKQIKDIQKKLQDTFNQEMSFKPVLTDIGKINKQLSEVAEKIKNANESASKVGNGKSNKKMDMLVQIENLSNKIVEATREYDSLE